MIYLVRYRKTKTIRDPREGGSTGHNEKLDPDSSAMGVYYSKKFFQQPLESWITEDLDLTDRSTRNE